MFVFGDARLCADGVLPLDSRARERVLSESSADVESGLKSAESYGLGENLGMISLPSDLFLSCSAGNVIAKGVKGGLAGNAYFSVLLGKSINLHLSLQYRKFPASAGNCLSQLVQKLKKDSSSPSNVKRSSCDVVVCLEALVV